MGKVTGQVFGKPRSIVVQSMTQPTSARGSPFPHTSGSFRARVPENTWFLHPVADMFTEMFRTLCLLTVNVDGTLGYLCARTRVQYLCSDSMARDAALSLATKQRSDKLESVFEVSRPLDTIIPIFSSWRLDARPPRSSRDNQREEC